MSEYSQAKDGKIHSDFMPGEVLFLIEHSQMLNPQQIKSQLYDHPVVNSDQRIRQAVEGANVNRIITFGRVQKPVPYSRLKMFAIRALRYLDPTSLVNAGETAAPYFSVVFTNVKDKDAPMQDEELIRVVRSLDRRIVGNQFNQRRRSLEPKRSIPDTTRSREVSASQVPPTKLNYRPEFTLMAASPNWAMSGGQGQTVTGGPGGWPEPTEQGVRVKPPEVKYPDITVLPQADTPDAPLDIYILDTAPTRMSKCDEENNIVKDEAKTEADVIQLLEAARKRWVEDQPTAPHELMGSLLKKSTSGIGFEHLDISMDHCMWDYSKKITLMEHLNNHKEGVAIRGHDYLMTDHGLFVASIIHRDLPTANLHLIQVLNDYGVGTIETLLRGIETVIKNYNSNNPTIVNCSLMMDIPRSGHPLNTDIPTVKDMLNELRSEETPLVRMGWFIEWACDLLTDLGMVVVASAGNDGPADVADLLAPPDSSDLYALRPQARYPAAFECVIGIAAAGSDDQPASYANWADDPDYDGFITFGGDATMVRDGGTRVLGVYIGDFPAGTPNVPPCLNGWAYWSGSSFAAPAISGLLGNFRGKGYDKPTALNQVRSGATAMRRPGTPTTPGSTPPKASTEKFIAQKRQ